MPLSFPHGPPSSSLEPGATDQQYPPTYLFPDPPMGSGPELLLETPLQAVSHLQDAVKNVQELTEELAKSLWEKPTDRERHFPEQHFPSEAAELVPAVSAHNLLTVHITPVYLATAIRCWMWRAMCQNKPSSTRGPQSPCAANFLQLQ